MNMEREIKRALDEFQWADYRIEKTSGGHYRVVLTAGDEQRSVFAASTPSDRRSIPNTRAELRRAIRDLSGPADVGLIGPMPKDRPAKKRNKHRSIHPKPDYYIADQLRFEGPPDRRSIQVPAPLEPHQRDVRARYANRWRVGNSAEPAPEPAPAPAPEPEAAPRARPTVQAPKRGTPEYRQMISRKLKAAWARRRNRAPGDMLDAAKHLRPVILRDPRWRDWRREHGVEASNISYPKIRELARQWGYTSEHGQWTERGRAAADRLGLFASEPASGPAPAASAPGTVQGTRRKGQPYKVSREVLAKLSANAAKARATRAANLAARAAAPAPEPKPRCRVPAVSVRVTTAAPETAQGRVSVARIARLSWRRKVRQVDA